MAERVYGDAAATQEDRNAATIARWILADRPDEVYVRHLQRNIRLPGLKTADQIRAAADALVEADWLFPPPPPRSEFASGRARVAYSINPRVWETAR
jgi:hypothetical protein